MPHPPVAPLWLGWVRTETVARAIFAYAAGCCKETSIIDAQGVPGAASQVGGAEWELCRDVAGSPSLALAPPVHCTPELVPRYPA